MIGSLVENRQHLNHAIIILYHFNISTKHNFWDFLGWVFLGIEVRDCDFGNHPHKPFNPSTSSIETNVSGGHVYGCNFAANQYFSKSS